MKIKLITKSLKKFVNPLKPKLGPFGNDYDIICVEKMRNLKVRVSRESRDPPFIRHSLINKGCERFHV